MKAETMTAKEILAWVESEGFKLRQLDGSLRFMPRPDKQPSEDLRRAVRQNEPELVLLLTADPPEPTPLRPLEGFPTLTLAELASRPPVDHLVEGFIPEHGFCAVIGKPGALKTFFCMDLGLCIATGALFHGREVRQGGVTYIVAEGGAGIGQRAVAWGIERSRELPENFHVIDSAPDFLSESNVSRIIATMQGNGSTTLFIDTLARTMGGDENSGKDMSAFIAACNRIQREVGATVIVVHHQGWNGDHHRGHSSLFGALDAELTLNRDGDMLTVTTSKAKDFEEGPAFSLQTKQVLSANGSTSIVLTDIQRDAYGVSGIAKRLATVLAVFEDEGATTTTWKEQAEAKGITRTAFYEGKSELKKAGWIGSPPAGERPHGFRYVLGPEGTAYVRSRSTDLQGHGREVGTSEVPPLKGDVPTFRTYPVEASVREFPIEKLPSRDDLLAWVKENEDGWGKDRQTPIHTKAAAWRYYGVIVGPGASADVAADLILAAMKGGR